MGKNSELIRYPQCRIEDLSEKHSWMTANLISIFTDLHLDYEYLIAKIKVGNFRKTFEIGFYLRDTDEFLILPDFNEVGEIK